MRVLYVIDRPNLFGSEQHLFDILQYQKVRNEIVVMTFRNGPLISKIESLGITIYNIDCLSWFALLKLYKRFKMVVRLFRPDIVHSHQPKAIFYMSLFCRLANLKQIATIHTDPKAPAVNYAFPLKIFIYLFHRFIILIVELLANKCVYVSNALMNQTSIYSKKSLVIHNWLSPRFYSIEKRNFRKCVTYLYVGSLIPSKGTKEVIEFFGKIHELDKNVILNIIGNGPVEYLTYLRKVIISNRFESSVFIRGYQDDIEKYYLESDVFISLTRGESFGLVFIEAMAHGLPIICSDLKILREVVFSENLFIGKKGFDKDEFISFLNRIENGALSDKNQKWVEQKYNYDLQQSLLSNLYNEVLISK